MSFPTTFKKISLLIFVLFCFSCSSEDDANPLFGVWELTNVETMDSPGINSFFLQSQDLIVESELTTESRNFNYTLTISENPMNLEENGSYTIEFLVNVSPPNAEDFTITEAFTISEFFGSIPFILVEDTIVVEDDIGFQIFHGILTLVGNQLQIISDYNNEIVDIEGNRRVRPGGTIIHTFQKRN